MSEDNIRWCTCKDHDHKNWQVVSDHYCRHFIPSGWSLVCGVLDQHEEGRILYLTGACNTCGGFMRSGTSVPMNVSGDELLAYIYREMTRFRPYDGYDKEAGIYNGAVSARAKWYQAQDDLTEEELCRQFVGLFQQKYQAQAEDWLAHNQPKRPYTKPHRDRKSTLFQNILDMARADGSMVEMGAILDCLNPEDCQPVPPVLDSYLTDSRFCVVPRLCFEGDEAVSLTLALEGSFDSSSSSTTRIGTLRIWNADIEACRLMGALGGVLMYHASRYLEQERYRYTPEQELVWELEKRGEQDGQ